MFLTPFAVLPRHMFTGTNASRNIVIIYQDEEMVGYVMVIYDYDVPEYDIWHMMIDGARQGRGYGKEALKRVLEYIGTKPFGESNQVVLTCNQQNIPGLRLYRSLGFQETGNVDEDEIEMVKIL